MNRPYNILAITFAAALQAAAIPRVWVADMACPGAAQFSAYRGETVELEAQLSLAGSPFALPAGASASMFISTNDFESCWVWPATVSTSGVVRAVWLPDYDPGASAVRGFLGVEVGGTNLNYHANFTLRLLGSPGAVPNELPPPTRSIDFSRLEILGAPWPDFGAISNIVSDAIAGIDFPDTSLEPATNYTDTVAANLGAALDSAEERWHADSLLLAALVNGTNTIIEITNYNSRVHAPTMRVLQMDAEEGQYHTVWAETNLHARTLAEANGFADAAYQSATNYAAPRAWSRTTSGLGVDAPPGSTWVSTPELVIAGGLEYEKHVTSGGEIWVLRNNGMAAQFHASTNNAAYLDISDNEGNSIFRIEKTDSVLVGVDVTELSIDGSTLICGINAVASDHPLARVATNLNGPWYSEEDGIPANVATVSWRGASGAWVCNVANTSGGNALFVTFEYLQEGGTKIVNAAPLDVSPGILCTDGIHKVRPVWNAGGAITWEVVQ